MKGTSKFELRESYHAGIKIFDIFINGMSLMKRIKKIEKINIDYISSIGWLPNSIHRLILNEGPDLPDGRISIYVCPICGDLGCGAVTTKIQVRNDIVEWLEMGIQNDFEPEIDFFVRVTGFKFNWTQYYNEFIRIRTI